MPNWIVRKYRPDDKEQSLALMEAVAGHAPDLAMWEWYIENNPYGADMGWVADDHGRVCGRYGMIPEEMQALGKRMPVTQAVEIMTHPDYRKQGMFPAMAAQVFADLPDMGYHFTIGFPNDAARPGHLKFGWKELGFINASLRPIHTAVVAKRAYKNAARAALVGLAGDIYLRLFHDWRRPAGLGRVKSTVIERFDSRFDELWQRVGARYPIALVRDSRYLNWRYVDCPFTYIKRAFEIDGKLVGCSIIRVLPRDGATEAHICDLILDADPAWLFDVAAWHALADARSGGADLLGFRMQSPDNYLQRFEKFGARRYQGKMILIVYDKNLPAGGLGVDHTDLNNWLVSMGDSDAI
jgi:GNAT superfamily N-acetyltransferase